MSRSVSPYFGVSILAITKKKIGVTDLASEIKRVENYPYFEKSVHVIQHGLHGFISRNIYSESKEANDIL